MNESLRAFKPTSLGIFLALFLLAAQVILLSSRSFSVSLQTDIPAVSESTFGIGPTVSIIEQGATRSVQIHWAALTLNLIATYMLACLLAMMLAKAAHFKKPATAYGITALVMVGIAFLVSITISKSYWGYFFKRPPLLQEAREIKSVTAILPVKTELINPGQHQFVADVEYSFSNRIAQAQADPYYCLQARILIELDNKKLLPATPATAISELPQLYAMVQNSGMLAQSEEGYHSSEQMYGVIVDGIAPSGDRLLFLGLTGASVSNDHHPYYELLFTGGSQGTQLSFKRGQRFFYDVAGIEGMEWYVMWMPLSILSIVLGFVVLTLWKLIRRRANRRPQKNPAALTAAGL
jgi:hypothetical protein